MPHHNSVFHAVLGNLPWDALDRGIARHDAGDQARSFSFKSQLVALLYGQIAGAASLRAIEAGLHSHADRLYHVGAAPASRTTLADAITTARRRCFPTSSPPRSPTPIASCAAPYRAPPT